MLKQLSVFVENKAGAVCEIAQALYEHNIDISALCIADTAKFGILRMIVDDPQRAVEVLREKGQTVSLTDVFAVRIEDRIGGMVPVLNLLNDNEIGVEYMYAFVGRDTSAYVVLRVEQIEKTKKLFEEKNIPGAEVKDLIKEKKNNQ